MTAVVILAVMAVVLTTAVFVIVALDGDSTRQAHWVIATTEAEGRQRDLRAARAAADREQLPGPTVDAGEFLAELARRRGV